MALVMKMVNWAILGDDEDREAWLGCTHRVAKSQTHWVTEQQLVLFKEKEKW